MGASVVGGLVLSGVLLVAMNGSTMAAPNSNDGSILYENSARIAYERFSGSEMTSASIKPKHLLPFQANDMMFGEELSHIIRDCSTVQSRCVSVWLRVFAVPRTSLSPKAMYAVAGAQLKVEDCLRGDDTVCQVALLSADCQRISDQSCQEVAGGREKSDRTGPITYFIYNEDFGVTAYGVTEDPAKTKEERLNIASQMVLIGQRGLLFSKSWIPVTPHKIAAQSPPAHPNGNLNPPWPMNLDKAARKCEPRHGDHNAVRSQVPVTLH